MAHFAKINNITNIVESVIVVSNDNINNLNFPESENVGIAFLSFIDIANCYWKQTSYNSNFRKTYAGVGSEYDITNDAFIPPKPFPSWILNGETYHWEAPTPCPNDGLLYRWIEPTGWKTYES